MACYSVPMRIMGSDPARSQSGQAPPSRALPRARPHSSLAARGCHEVDEPLTCSSTPPSDHPPQPPLFSSFCSNAGELPAPWNSPRLLPVRAPKAPPQLRQELSYPLNPSPQALTIHSSNLSRSPPTPAETTVVGTSPRPALLRAPLPPLSSSLKSRWATHACAPLGLCSTCL